MIEHFLKEMFRLVTRALSLPLHALANLLIAIKLPLIILLFCPCMPLCTLKRSCCPHHFSRCLLGLCAEHTGFVCSFPFHLRMDSPHLVCLCSSRMLNSICRLKCRQHQLRKRSAAGIGAAECCQPRS